MSSYKTDYIVIENLSQFLTKVPPLHPEDPRSIKFWSLEIAKCIEGVWGREFGGWRFMPGNLYFYGNYTKIQDTDINKVTKYLKPTIWDIVWELCYYMRECAGFSGWSDDNEFTSDLRYFEFKETPPDLSQYDPSNKEDKIIIDSILALYDKDGKLKKFKPARQNIKEIHDKPKGRMLFHNSAKNAIVFGTRGGGKSYYYALGEFAYTLLFDGCKTYEDFLLQESKAELCIGSSLADKSSEFCQKIKDYFTLLSFDSELGAHGEPGDMDYAPSPLYRTMSGTLSVGNKKNPYRYEYEALEKAGIYSQLTINPFVGFVYKSNIIENREFYSHLSGTDIKEASAAATVSSEEMDSYAKKITLNFLMGTDMNDVSVEEKEKMFFAMYDTTQKQVYFAKVDMLGFGHDKTMHAPE